MSIASKPKGEKNVTEANALLDHAYADRIHDLKLSLDLTQQAIELATEAGAADVVARAQSQLGLLLMINGDFTQALQYSEEALIYFEKVKDIKGIGDAKYNIAGVHYKTNNFHLGLQFLLDCLHIYRQLQDLYNEARVLKSMGTIYEYFGDLDNAIETYLRSIQLAKQIKDTNVESNAYNPLSGIYLKRDEPELAMATIEKSVSLKKQTKDVRGLAFALYGRGKVYLYLKNFEKAEEDLNAALDLQSKMGDKLGICMAYNKLGRLFYESGNYTNATLYLELALQTSRQYDIQFIQFKSCYQLHLVARAKGNAHEALELLDEYTKIKEGVINSHTNNVIKSYEAISRIKSLEREAQSQQEKTEIIEKKNAELDSFFYRVSHDLKGPISSLLGLHNLINLEIKDKDSLQYFNLYHTQILRMNSIVMDLIELTRMNHTEGTKSKIDFDAILDDCISSYQYLDNFKHVKFSKSIDPTIDYRSEWAIVNTILQNLIENAIKYARIDKDPFVSVTIKRKNPNIIIIVADNGMGIREEFKSNVFNMFFRANDRIQGTGLGLYILKRAVERLQGEVTFESQINSGSTFTISLPSEN